MLIGVIKQIGFAFCQQFQKNSFGNIMRRWVAFQSRNIGGFFIHFYFFADKISIGLLQIKTQNRISRVLFHRFIRHLFFENNICHPFGRCFWFNKTLNRVMGSRDNVPLKKFILGVDVLSKHHQKNKH